MDFGRSNSPEVAAGLNNAASENAILAAQAELRTKHGTEGKSKNRGLHIVPCAAPDVRALIRDVEDILQGTDQGQAALTWRFIEAGRLLWKIRKSTKHGDFDELLAREFPRRSRSTLREYMTLAKGFDAADPAIQVQLTGLFHYGWTTVLEEIRRRKRLKKSRARSGPPAKGDAESDNLRILLGDCMTRLRELPDESVDCVITSPPYYQRVVFPGATAVFNGKAGCDHTWHKTQVTRRHSANKQDVVESGTCSRCGASLVMLGWEDNPAEYIEHLGSIFDEIRRILKPTGVLWINIDDAFANKGLLQIPQRLSIALTDRGWIYRQDVIWEITNRAPQSASDRFSRTHEYLLMFVKQEQYFFDNEAVREPISLLGKKHGHGFTRQKPAPGSARASRVLFAGPVDGRRRLRTVWPIPSERLGGDHFAPFPKALVERMLLSSCPEGGICLDPFAGSGTTGLVARAHRRKAILIEANADYCGIAKRRIETELGPYKAELEMRREQERSNHRHLDA